LKKNIAFFSYWANELLNGGGFGLRIWKGILMPVLISDDIEEQESSRITNEKRCLVFLWLNKVGALLSNHAEITLIIYKNREKLLYFVLS
jgi:hypothetical protein